VLSYLGRKASRGDIIIGRSARSLKAWPSTHDTISHLYGLDEEEDDAEQHDGEGAAPPYGR
jgi:hypothetical protein